MLQYPVRHPASQHTATDGSLFCQTCNSAISWRITHRTAVEFSKRPCIHMESRENVFGIPLGGPLTGRLYTAEVSCLLQSCWKCTEVRRHGNHITVVTGVTLLVSLKSWTRKVYKTEAEVLPLLTIWEDIGIQHHGIQQGKTAWAVGLATWPHSSGKLSYSDLEKNLKFT